MIDLPQKQTNKPKQNHMSRRSSNLVLSLGFPWSPQLDVISPCSEHLGCLFSSLLELLVQIPSSDFRALPSTAVCFRKITALLNLTVLHLQNGNIHVGKNRYFKLPFYECGNWDLEKLNSLFKATKLIINIFLKIVVFRCTTIISYKTESVSCRKILFQYIPASWISSFPV